MQMKRALLPAIQGDSISSQVYQGTRPLASKNPPVGPSAPICAIRTMISAPSATETPFLAAGANSVAVSPGVTELTRHRGNARAH
jgi:hypothetical protein